MTDVNRGPVVANTNYIVLWAPGGMTAIPLIDLPASGKTLAHFEVQTSAPLFAGDLINFIIYM